MGLVTTCAATAAFGISFLSCSHMVKDFFADVIFKKDKTYDETVKVITRIFNNAMISIGLGMAGVGLLTANPILISVGFGIALSIVLSHYLPSIEEGRSG